MLAQFATVSEGMVNTLGAGWMVRPPEPAGPAAVVVMVSVPRDQEGDHVVRVELLDAQGQRVHLGPPYTEIGEQQELSFEAQVSAQGRPGVDPELPLLAPFAFTIGPFPLPAGQSFRWQVFVDGETREGWSVGFRTSPP